ncbi:HU family DNA-binding protein [Thiospirillum jenense]|uniref:HU family DNA-binding protein n=1 Tax=Thiospirillum jenense TaxID=1653858 RepID=A0A839H7L6_9GAMM|nr:HU family DNA-binding protein [Thiospirillum jenense]MBB1125174.1 HU family DNA-binding protein [Thiospirillum jenense]
MNKSDLIDAMAETADIPKAAATRALDALIDTITESLKQGDTVSIIGFGTFSVKERAARTGRNPRTGEPLEIGASKSPAFKPGKGLKDALAS